MKVRLLGNSIRFRLKKPEVEQFEQTGIITEIIEFGPEPSDQIRFSLVTHHTMQELVVSFHANTTTIKVPEALAREWVQTQQVGFGGKVETGKGKIINVLVEKDFMCIDGNEMDNEGAYPNPVANC